jgi:hypothetical protein
MDYQSEKHKELSEQLTAWWGTQTKFKTKKELAELLSVHPDTLGDYFSGRKFPKPDIADRLYELTNIKCLELDVSRNSSPKMYPPGSFSESLLPPPTGDCVSKLEPQKSNIAGPSELAKGKRFRESSVVISLQRTICP